MLTHGTIGLFGKIPAQGDFLRVNVADPVAQGLVLWFDEGVAAIHRGGAKLAGDPVRFLFRVPGAQKLLAGAFTPSADKVGRAFPLAVFVPVQMDEAENRYPFVPNAYRSFLDAATSLLAESPQLDGRQLADRLSGLPLPNEAELSSAGAFLREWARTERAGSLAERIFGDLSAGRHAYGFWTFQSACRPIRGREPARANVALDCPATQEIDLFAWLELARRTLCWQVVPPFFWRNGIAGHLLLSVGPALGTFLTYLSDPSRTTNKVWPLETTDPAAIESARRALGAARLGDIGCAGISLEELLELLSR